jgi:hypothetical protein
VKKKHQESRDEMGGETENEAKNEPLNCCFRNWRAVPTAGIKIRNIQYPMKRRRRRNIQ